MAELDIREVTALDEPELAPYRTMRRPLEHRLQQIFVAEGVKVVARLLESNIHVLNVLMPHEWFERFKPLLMQRPEPVLRVWLADRKLVEHLTGFELFQGVMAIARVPPQPSIEEMVAKAERPALFVALDGLTNAENVGGIIRCCAGFYVQGVIAGETCCSPYLRRAVRSSMGSVFDLAVIESQDLAKDLVRLRAAGIQIVAAHPRPGAVRIDEWDFTADCCIVFGSEGYGIRPEVLEVCEQMVAIPMPEGFDSLNVCHAAAVFLYEANRQRGFPAKDRRLKQETFCSDQFFISPRMRLGAGRSGQSV